MKRLKNTFHANGSHKRAGEAMIVSDKIELYPSLSEVTKTFYDDKRISLP
jgi:hypothetical protein